MRYAIVAPFHVRVVGPPDGPWTQLAPPLVDCQTPLLVAAQTFELVLSTRSRLTVSALVLGAEALLAAYHGAAVSVALAMLDRVPSLTSSETP